MFIFKYFKKSKIFPENIIKKIVFIKGKRENNIHTQENGSISTESINSESSNSSEKLNILEIIKKNFKKKIRPRRLTPPLHKNSQMLKNKIILFRINDGISEEDKKKWICIEPDEDSEYDYDEYKKKIPKTPHNSPRPPPLLITHYEIEREIETAEYN